MDQLSLRPLVHADLPLLAEWLATPYVARWWHDDPAEVFQQYGAYLQAGDPVLLVALLDGRPVGMVQLYRWAADEAAPYGLPAGTHGLDYLIGSAHDCDRGVGSRMIEVVLEVLPAGDVWVTPEEANGPSCRVLENNGLTLVAVKQCQVPEEPWAGPTALYQLIRPSER